MWSVTHRSRLAAPVAATVLIFSMPAWCAGSAGDAESTDSAALAKLREEAEAIRPLVESRIAREFLNAVAHLPIPSSRTLHRDEQRNYHDDRSVSKLTEAQREKLTAIPVTDSLYYNTKYGTPLAYVRLLDVLGKAGIKDAQGLRILDYGYGTVGHLRLLAACGADAVGVDVDPFLSAIYCLPEDQGKVKATGKRAGQVTLVHGRWPGESATKKTVGGSYDLIISKNTLKNGYLHPEREVDPRMLIDLGVGEDEFVSSLYASLKPGGHVMIYNISPAPAPPDKPYIPWADGRCPFPKAMLQEAGFALVEFDKDDSEAVREMARAFGWDKGPNGMDLEKNLFAHFTLLRKPA